MTQPGSSTSEFAKITCYGASPVSYVVFARKYRPMQFADMVGQEHIARTLGNAIQHGRVHHAYLFAGARGLGKTTTARIFAKGLVCEKGPSAQPCNECEQCLGVNESRSVDVVEIDGASNNSVDNIRNLREQVHYLPQSARRKVYIIDEVHMLTTSAFNALLKTLEEPPPHVNFVFATTEPQKVLPTILSRVSRLDFRRVSVEQQVAHLGRILELEELKIEPGGLALIARASGGSVRDGLTLLDQVVAFSANPKAIDEAETRSVLGQAHPGAIADLIDAIVARDPDAVISQFESLVAAGHDLQVVSLQILEQLRDLTVARVCKARDALGDRTDSEYEALKTRANKTDPATLAQLFDRFSRIIDRLPASRAQRLLLEMGLLELVHTDPVIPLGDLVERLDQLADRGTDGGGRGGGAPRRASSGHDPVPATANSKRPVEASSKPAANVAAAPASTTGPGDSPDRPHPTPAPPTDPHPTPTQPPAPIAAPPTPAQRLANGSAAVPPTPAAPAAPPATQRPSAAGNSPQAPAPPTDVGDSDFSRGLWNLVKQRMGSDPPPTTGPTAATEPSPPAAPDRSQAGPHPSSTGGPCSPPPPPKNAIDIDQIDTFAAWEQLVERIRTEDEYVSAVLSEVGLARLEGGTLRIAAPPRSFAHTELTARPDIRGQVEQATRDHFGRSYQVELIDAEPSLPKLPSIVLVDAHRRAEHRAQVESDAQQNPTIANLMSTFNAALTKTKPLSEP